MHTPNEDPTAVHSVTTHGDHVVALGNINVLLLEEGGCWYAQSLEIDYTAQGSSYDEVKQNFEVGFLSTIRANIKLHGSIAPLLVPAPSEIWKETLNLDDGARRFSCISIQLRESLQEDVMNFLPFKGINYLRSEAHG